MQRAGNQLTFAIGQMQHRMKEEEQEGQLFHVDDHIMHPSYFSDRLSVRVSYSWRKTTDDEWAYSSITFTHVVDIRPRFLLPAPKRKPSAAKKLQDLNEKRYDAWEQLKQTALYTVRDFFRAGGDGCAIPDSFPAVVDSDGILNNHSLKFYSKIPKA